MTQELRIPVLVVGAGVAGLSAALFLAQQGVECLLVERHESTNFLPRARGVNGRTMELMRELGIAEEIQRAGEKLAPAVGIYRGSSVVETIERKGTGNWLTRRARSRGMRNHASKKSPSGPCRCPQDELEPIMLCAAYERGVDVKFATELVSFDQNDAGIFGVLRDLRTGESRRVHADFMIAADGSKSPIRKALGIERSGSRTSGHQVNVLFLADLTSLVRGREFSMCLVENEHVRGLVASIDNAKKWVIHISYDPERGERPEDFTPSRCAELVRHAIGIPNLAVEILGVSPWQSAVRVAKRFRDHRIFLVGDAAHSMPPWGGFGANSAIQDSHNLAWKIALVLAGTANEKLLATYEDERMPVDRALAELSGTMSGERGLISLPKRFGAFRLLWAMRKIFPYLTMGYGYTSSAIATEKGIHPGPNTSSLDGAPGTRAPHVWIARDGKRVSTLDLIAGKFVLFIGKNADFWRHAANEASKKFRTRVACVQIEETKPLGIRDDGALLVRPDGIVAWRAKKMGPQGALETALSQVLAATA